MLRTFVDGKIHQLKVTGLQPTYSGGGLLGVPGQSQDHGGQLLSPPSLQLQTESAARMFALPAMVEIAKISLRIQETTEKEIAEEERACAEAKS